MSIETSTPCRNNVPSAGRIFQVESKYDIKQKLQKRDVMPTWAATKSLLLSNRGDVEVKRTNSQAIAPLFRTSPTEYTTLYTVLNLTQEISSTVIGPNSRTLITLDIDLYNRAIQIQESVAMKIGS